MLDGAARRFRPQCTAAGGGGVAKGGEEPMRREEGEEPMRWRRGGQWAGPRMAGERRGGLQTPDHPDLSAAAPGDSSREHPVGGGPFQRCASGGNPVPFAALGLPVWWGWGRPNPFGTVRDPPNPSGSFGRFGSARALRNRSGSSGAAFAPCGRHDAHGKNCTAGAVYTYHEKRKDTAASGYGTQRLRIGDAVKDFDCCCLSLQPCRDPVVTPDGFLYEREAIVQYLLHRKGELARQRKAYRRQQQKEKEKQSPLAAGGSTEGTGGSGPSGTLPSFWIPSHPEAGAERLRKPEGSVRCPMSGRRLRLRDLTPVRFTAVDPGLQRPLLLGRPPGSRYRCAVSGDPLGNATPCAVLRPSGAVVTLDCVERLIRKEMKDPTTGEALSEGDIIVLQRGGTGFAGSGICLEAQKSRPVMQA
ncbi:LOW QUALITY PROTEIN: nitric oxide synthase-interacting protein [Amazona ochrocephala]